MWFPCLSVRLNTFLYVFENLDFLFDNVLIKVLCPFSCWGICHFLFSLLTVFMFYEELTHWKRLWCWEGLGAEEGDDREWDGWMASPTQWMWVWVNSGSWWWTGRPGVLRFMELQRVGHDWVTDLNWLHFKKWITKM